MNKILEYLINNWALIIAALSVFALVVINVIDFFKKPTSEQIASLKSWLLFAVTEAEKFLGSGTGKLKLRYVYDLFLEKFPYIAQVISFDTFSKYVDEALDEMRELLSSNKNIAAYVNGQEVSHESK